MIQIKIQIDHRKQYECSTGLVPPIMIASTYKTPVDYVLNDPDTYVYGRYANVSRDGAEVVIAALEDAKHGYIFSSGSKSFDRIQKNNPFLRNGCHQRGC